MPVTAQELSQLDQFKDVSLEVLSQFEQFHNGRESKAVDEATNKAYSAVDKVVAEITGQPKPGGVFTSAHVKSTLEGLKTSADQVEGLKKKLADAEKLAGQGDNGAQVQELQKRIDGLESKQKRMQKDHSDALAAKQKQLEDAQADFGRRAYDMELDAAQGGITLNEGFDKNIQAALFRDARSRLSDNYTRVQEDGKTVYYKGEARVNDPATQKPLSTQQLLMRELGSAVKIEEKKTGAGTNPGGQGSGGSSTFALNGAKTKQEAQRQIDAFLAEQGVVKGTKEHSEQRQKLYSEHVAGSELPMT